MMTQPYVSVVVTTYRRDDMLKQCLQSLVNQTLPLQEVVVVDDGGDGTARAVVEAFGERFRYLWQPNGGMQRARNVGSNAATGEWIAYLDDDDLWLPMRHELLAKVVATNDADLIEGDFVKFRENWLSPTGMFHEIELHSPRFWDGIPHKPDTDYSIVGSFPTTRLIPVSPFWPSALAIRRDLLNQIGGWNEKLAGVKSEDIEFLFRAIKHGQFSLIWKPTVKYRCHAGNDSNSNLYVALGRIYIWENLLNEQELTNQETDLLKKEINENLHKIIWSAFREKKFDIVINMTRKIKYKNLNFIEKMKYAIAKLLNKR